MSIIKDRLRASKFRKAQSSQAIRRSKRLIESSRQLIGKKPKTRTPAKEEK